MKKLLLIAAVAFLGISSVKAQEIEFGVKGGLNVATLGGDASDDYDLDSRVGFHVGGFVEIPLSEKITFQPELLYSMQGAQLNLVYTDGLNSVSSEAKLKLDYINVPFMFKYEVVDNLAVEVGPQIGFLINAKGEVEASVSGESGSYSDEIDVKDQYSTIDFAANLGVSYEFDMGLFAGARYNFGLIDIEEESDDYSEINNVFQLSIGYKF
ncbi:Outer membrane protein beta-barrel domain-containing protein [Mesonia phycicola]|uniref:Outer membrane protein beta-barrel domain-containing protein n=1 Tax=Mesonia phycicola TaxID=579105 RepID=A0A1M6FGK3_9FLAO|nr:porin family protein [Mesonia phycicola]SHI96763.1 Outer membrane protein beta-barrel domain-containing protein [Mesonia phycicola]